MIYLRWLAHGRCARQIRRPITATVHSIDWSVPTGGCELKHCHCNSHCHSPNSDFLNLRCANVGPSCARSKTTIFPSDFNLISPVQPSAQKYSTSVLQKSMFLSPHPDSTGGAARDRHGRRKQDAVDVRVLSAL
jgi:hypothetical protein